MTDYEQLIKSFETKHGMTFVEFSKKLEYGATIHEEDDWLEWEAALNIVEGERRQDTMNRSIYYQNSRWNRAVTLEAKQTPTKEISFIEQVCGIIKELRQ